MLFVRKINLAKWKQKLIDDNDHNSDPITIDLRTSGNTLSLWRIKEESEEEIKEAVLALASNFERLGKMAVILINEEDLSKYSLDIKNNLGNGKYFSYNEEHFDIINITYNKLNPIGNIICEKVKADNFLPFSKADVKEIIQNGINTGKLEKEHLHEKLQSELN